MLDKHKYMTVCVFKGDTIPMMMCLVFKPQTVIGIHMTDLLG